MNTEYYFNTRTNPRFCITCTGAFIRLVNWCVQVKRARGRTTVRRFELSCQDKVIYLSQKQRPNCGERNMRARLVKQVISRVCRWQQRDRGRSQSHANAAGVDDGDVLSVGASHRETNHSCTYVAVTMYAWDTGGRILGGGREMGDNARPSHRSMAPTSSLIYIEFN